MTPWGIQINECYGMSESTAACTLSTQRCHLWGSCGFQLPGFEVKAFQVDPETWLVKGSMGRYVWDMYISTLTWLHVCVFDLYKYIINIYAYIPWILVQSYVIVHLYTVFYVFIFVALENPWGLYQAAHVRRRKEYLNERSYSCQALMTLAIGLLGDGEISWNCCDSLIAWESIQLAKVATSCTDKYLQSGQRTSCFVGYYCST